MTPSTFRPDVLAGKRILVTGGGTGLGKEMARTFVGHGASVHICGRREGVLQEAAEELRSAAQHGGSIATHVCDVREAEQIEAMVDRIWAGGPLTGLVNNAAANFISPSTEISPRGFAAVRSTVMDGALFATLACGKRWIRDGLPGLTGVHRRPTQVNQAQHEGDEYQDAVDALLQCNGRSRGGSGLNRVRPLRRLTRNSISQHPESFQGRTDALTIPYNAGLPVAPTSVGISGADSSRRYKEQTALEVRDPQRRR